MTPELTALGTKLDLRTSTATGRTSRHLLRSRRRTLLPTLQDLPIQRPLYSSTTTKTTATIQRSKLYQTIKNQLNRSSMHHHKSSTPTMPKKWRIKYLPAPNRQRHCNRLYRF